MADRFEDLRTFVAVIQEGGFSAAADRLGLAKSAVSRRVRDLEARLAVRLINRTSRGLSLTEAGQTFLERATGLLADLAEAESIATLSARQATGRLRVTAPVSFTIHCLAPVIGKFLAMHPLMEVEIETDDRIVDIVERGFDLAIRISRLKDSSLIARRISPIRHAAVASPDYLARRGSPRVPADLNDHDGIAYCYVDQDQYWTFRNGEVAEPTSRLLLSNAEAMREAAIAGCGVAFLPTFITYEAIGRGQLAVVLADHLRPPIGLYAVYPSSRHLPAKVRLFVDFLVAHFGEEPYWDDIALGHDKRM